MKVVSSFFEGRVRLRAEIFKDENAIKEISSILDDVKGVTSYQFKSNTGSLLIEYDTIKLPFIKIKKALPLLEAIKKMYEEDFTFEELKPYISDLKKILC